MVIFTGEKFRENVGKTFHMGVIFMILLLIISFIKSYGFYFRVGVIFAKETKSWKTRKLPQCENFHVYSINLTVYCLNQHIDLQIDLNVLYQFYSRNYKSVFCDISAEQ